MVSARLKRKGQRGWYYFRLGYSSYFTFLIGLAESVTVQYVLFVQRLKIPITLLEFTLIFGLSVFFTSMLSGLLHKRYQLGIESEVLTTINPFTFKIQPGKEERIMIPMILFNLETSRLTLQALGKLTPQLETKYDEWVLVLKRFQSGESFA